MLTRRTFLTYGIRLSILAFLGFGFERRNNVKTEHVTLEFSTLPPAFDNFRIVQISDLHASFWVGENYLAQVVKKINEIEKDLLVITGDIITGSVNDFWKRWMPFTGKDYLPMVADVLGSLNTGKKLAVLGNHDQWDGKKTEQRLTKKLSKIDIRVLRNSSEKLTRNKESIFVAGTDDCWFSYNFEKAMRHVPENGFKIMLSHNPDVRTDIEKRADVDLTLCGHTHGGQVAIPLVSHHFIPIKEPGRYISGLVKETYGYTYVNRGIGTLVFPFRLAAPPEITVFTLKQV
jgi:predicted MPP superfamily phosphohydrolase